MSKQDLEKLVSNIEKGLTEKFRKLVDYNNLVFEYSVDNIDKEIKAELKATNQELPNETVAKIAEDIAKKLDQAFTNHRSRALTLDKTKRTEEIQNRKVFLSTGPGFNTFRVLSGILRPVRKILIELVEKEGIKVKPISKEYTSNEEGVEPKTVLSKEFFNIEHISTVSDLRIANEFIEVLGSKEKAVRVLNAFKSKSSEEVQLILDEYILSIISNTNEEGTIIKDLHLRLEWKSAGKNKQEGREDILKRRNLMAKELRRILDAEVAKQIKIKKTLGASYTIEVLAAKKYSSSVDDAIKQTDRIRKEIQPHKISRKSTNATKSFEVESKRVAKQKVTMGPSGLSPEKTQTSITTTSSMEGPSALQVIAYINARLQQEIEKNMIPPALESRTGRFSGSVKVLNVLQTRKGFPSFEYTYDKNPYQVFEMGVGRSPWATVDRDPRKLIDKSIREIAAEMLQGRLYTRRV